MHFIELMFTSNTWKNVYGIIVGCICMMQNNRDILICSSVENFQSAEWGECTKNSDVHVTGRSGERERLSIINSSRVLDIKFLFLTDAIDDIQDGAVGQFENLSMLQIHHAYLPTIKVNYFIHPKLYALHLFESNINDIEEGAFLKLTGINRINLDGNNIPIIKKGYFTNVTCEYLSLTGNNIESIEDEAFSGMDNLRYFRLSGNKLKMFDSKRVFGKSLSLFDVEMERNLFVKLTKDMVGAWPNLRRLVLGRNEIQEIEDGVLDDLIRLQFFDLSHNKVGELKSNIFGENKVKVVNVSCNRLSYLSWDLLEKLPNLMTLILKGNPFQCSCLSEVYKFLEERVYKVGYKKISDLNCIETGLECVYDLDESLKMIGSEESYRNITKICRRSPQWF